MNIKNVFIRTERCVLRPPDFADMALMRSWREDERVSKWMPSCVGEKRKSVEECVNECSNTYAFLIIRKEDDIPIGDCMLTSQVDGIYRMTFCLHPDLWGQHYMAEVIGSVLRWVTSRETTDIERIVANVFTFNTRAKGVLSRVGFQMGPSALLCDKDMEPLPGICFFWDKPRTA